MYWCHFVNFFHSLAKPDAMVARAAEGCYAPFLDLLEQHPQARMTVNIDASLTERLHRVGHGMVVERLAGLARRGQVELTASAYGGAILPSLSADAMKAQVERNTAINRAVLGDVYKPVGFFPPEMAYAPSVAPMVRDLGYRWLLLDELAHTGKPGTPRADRLYRIKGMPEVTVLFRDRSISMGLVYGNVTSADGLMDALAQRDAQSAYLFTATEVDVFSLRREGPRAFLKDMAMRMPLKMATVSELCAAVTTVEEASPVPASWSSWDALAF